jgi:hypothetical protein
MIHINIIFPTTCINSNQFLSLRVSHQTLHVCLYRAVRVACRPMKRRRL